MPGGMRSALAASFWLRRTSAGSSGSSTRKRTTTTDRPGAEVCWLVLGVRRDPWAVAHRLPVEEDKDDEVRGRYLHPDVRDGAQQLFAHPEHEELLRRSTE